MLMFSDYLVELKLTLQYHEELNPKIWTSTDKLNPEVRTALIKFAHARSEEHTSELQSH